MPLLDFTPNGIYCAAADVYIDPWKPVERALITHGHSDHARGGHRYYIATHAALPVIRHRLGAEIKIRGIEYGETISRNGVQFSFHPAGHIPGSAQIRVEYRGEIWVVSGDYKVTPDGLSEPFEPIRCHTFITECTFGLPVYKWPPQELIFQQINDWWRQNQAAGKTTLLTGYALGKAQRLLQGLDPSIGTIYTHGAIENTNEILREQGLNLHPTTRLTAETPREALRGQLVLAPPSTLDGPWMRRLGKVSTGIASGWMTLRGARRRRAADRGFPLSDHADWDELNLAVRETGAEHIITTHGYTDLFSRWLSQQGLRAHPERTEFEGELSEISESEPS